jgi:hypothetical protein
MTLNYFNFRLVQLTVFQEYSKNRQTSGCRLRSPGICGSTLAGHLPVHLEELELLAMVSWSRSSYCMPMA